MKENGGFAPYHHDDENHIDSLTPLLYEHEQKQYGAGYSNINKDDDLITRLRLV